MGVARCERHAVARCARLGTGCTRGLRAGLPEPRFPAQRARASCRARLWPSSQAAWPQGLGRGGVPGLAPSNATSNAPAARCPRSAWRAKVEVGARGTPSRSGRGPPQPHASQCRAPCARLTIRPMCLQAEAPARRVPARRVPHCSVRSRHPARVSSAPRWRVSRGVRGGARALARAGSAVCTAGAPPRTAAARAGSRQSGSRVRARACGLAHELPPARPA